MTDRTPSGRPDWITRRGRSDRPNGPPVPDKQTDQESTLSIEASIRGDSRTFPGDETFTVDITATNAIDQAAAPFRVGYNMGWACSVIIDPGIEPIAREQIVDHTDEGGTYENGWWEWDSLPGNTTVTPSLTFRSIPNPALDVDPTEPREWKLDFTAYAPERCDTAATQVPVTIRTDGTPSSDGGSTSTITATPGGQTADVPDVADLRQGHRTEVRTRSVLQGSSSPFTEGGRYFVIRDIPGLEADRRAVVTPDYEYVPRWETLDALWVENYVTHQRTQDVISHHEGKQEWSRDQRETYNTRQTWSRISELLINAAQILTLIKTVDAEEAVSEAFDAFTDIVTWAKYEAKNDPFKEGFTDMAHSLESAAWAEELPDSTREHGKDVEALVDESMNVYFEYYQSAEDVTKVWAENWEGDTLGDIWRKDIDPEKLDARAAGKRVFVNLAMKTLDHFVEEYFRAEARHAAVLSSLHTVRLTVLDKIINILQDIEYQAVSPGQLLRYHVYRYVLYQMTAFGNEYAGGLMSQQGGPMVWLKSALPNRDAPPKRAEKHHSWAKENRRRAKEAFSEIGATRSDIGRRLDRSVNAVVHGMEGQD